MTDGGPGAADSSVDTSTTPAAGPAVTKPELPYGAWPSPITAADVAVSGLRLSFVTTIGGDTWWQEGRPDEGGRTTVVCHAAGGKQTALLPAPWNARTRVHEYGGLSYLPVPRAAGQAGKSPRGRSVIFANYADQRLYLAGPQVAEGRAEPQPLTPDPQQIPSATGSGMLAASALRFADFVLSPDAAEVWCVQERHDAGQVSRAIVAVPLDGSAAADAGAIRTLVTGSDFYAFPSPSPSGGSLAWLSWNHPHMPWDGTELRVAALSDGVPGKSRLLKGSLRESVMAPLWRDETSLYIATDWTGWWNIYQVSLNGAAAAGAVPGRRGVRRAAVAARRAAVRAAGRWPAGRRARPRRRAAGHPGS